MFYVYCSRIMSNSFQKSVGPMTVKLQEYLDLLHFDNEHIDCNVGEAL